MAVTRTPALSKMTPGEISCTSTCHPLGGSRSSPSVRITISTSKAAIKWSVIRRRPIGPKAGNGVRRRMTQDVKLRVAQGMIGMQMCDKQSSHAVDGKDPCHRTNFSNCKWALLPTSRRTTQSRLPHFTTTHLSLAAANGIE